MPDLFGGDVKNVEAAKRGVDSVDTGATMTDRGRQRSVKPLYYNTLSSFERKSK
jgi:hypothetical protein